MFPSLKAVKRAICLNHNPEKLGKPSGSSLEWQPKPLSKYAHHDSRTEDAYLLCFHPSQSLKRLFSSTMIRKSSESIRKAASNGLSEFAHHDSRTEDAYLLCFHPLQSLKRLFPSTMIRKSSESIRKAALNGSLKPRVSILTMTVVQKMLTLCVSIPHSR